MTCFSPIVSTGQRSTVLGGTDSRCGTRAKGGDTLTEDSRKGKSFLTHWFPPMNSWSWHHNTSFFPLQLRGSSKATTPRCYAQRRWKHQNVHQGGLQSALGCHSQARKFFNSNATVASYSDVTKAQLCLATSPSQTFLLKWDQLLLPPISSTWCPD